MQQNNRIELRGRIIEEPKFSHKAFNEDIYELKLQIKRLSKACDELVVSFSDRIYDINELSKGNLIDVNGEIRTYNRIIENKSRLIIRTFAHDIHQTTNESESSFSNPNKVFLEGRICKKPIYRSTPLNKEICDILIACNREYNKSDYIPVIAWGKNARFAGNLSAGDKVVLNGRLQSRNYSKSINDQETIKTAYEVSASNILLR